MESAEALKRFLRSREARGLSAKTIGFYHYCLDRFVAKYPELPEGPDELEEYLTGIGLSSETRYDVWRALRTFYRFANVRWEVKNAMKSVGRPKQQYRLPRTLSREEVDRLLRSELCRRDRAIITMLLDTGIRLGELECLLYEQIGSETIRVSGKTGTREVPLGAAARKALIGVELPWSGPRGKLTRNGLYLAVRRAMRAAGIRRGGPHTLRHSFARYYILNGGDIFSLQRILGHRSIETTRIYLDFDTRDIVAQHAKYSLLVK